MERIIKHSNGLKGTVIVQGDKSISHRAVMLGSIATGTTTIKNFLQGADCLSTIDCFRDMGTKITVDGSNVTVHGKGRFGLTQPDKVLYTGNSGTTTRIISGILVGQQFDCKLTGDETICKRPMGRIITPLTRMGASIQSKDGFCPLKIKKSTLTAIRYELPVASAQLKSAVLLAGLYTKDNRHTTVIEKVPSRNHTEKMLVKFGADICVDGNTIKVSGKNELVGCDIYVPGDISSAAFYMVAALITKGSDILIKDVGLNETRAGIIKVLQHMGGDVTVENRVDEAEPYGDIRVRYSQLRGINIGGEIIPNIIDEIPIIAVAAAFAEGVTTITDAKELKVKESNRIDSMTRELSKGGVDIRATDDGMIINGGGELKGARFNSYYDHRIAMALSIFSLAAQGEGIIEGSQIVSVSCPDFFDTLENLSC